MKIRNNALAGIAWPPLPPSAWPPAAPAPSSPAASGAAGSGTASGEITVYNAQHEA